MKKEQLKSSLLLLLTAFIWGIAFVAQSVGGDAVGGFTFQGVRNIIGSLVLLPVIMAGNRKKKEKTTAEDGKTLLLGGIFCGILLCIAGNLQQLGIAHTTVGKAGFITAMYILIVPVLGIFLKKKAGLKVWISVFFGAAGLYLLCMNGESFSMGTGDLLVLACSFVFSLHILVIDHFSPKVDGVKLSCIQFFVCGVLSMILAFCFEKPSIQGILAGWLPILYAGALSCGAGYTLQIIGQKHMNAAVASLILSLESVFSVLAGWVILHQTLTGRELFGCLFMFAAIILAQLPQKQGK